jgi:hypothetical protein
MQIILENEQDKQKIASVFDVVLKSAGLQAKPIIDEMEKAIVDNTKEEPPTED